MITDGEKKMCDVDTGSACKSKVQRKIYRRESEYS